MGRRTATLLPLNVTPPSSPEVFPFFSSSIHISTEMKLRSSTSITTALVLLVAVASAQNYCYYAPNSRAGSAIIPCGGAGTQSSCCQLGDLCLSDSACWNPTHNVTYLYGCTDSSYKDSTCPWKCGSSFTKAPYVGLDYCYNTTQNEWSCTHPPSNSDSIQTFGEQQCLADSIIAFAGPSSLQPILSLPSQVGGSTVWFSQVNPTSYILNPKYTPTTTAIFITASVPTTVQVVSTTSKSTQPASTDNPIGGVTASSLSTAFSPTNNPASTSSSIGLPQPTISSGLSTGAKIGIGVGVSLGALGFIALAAAIFFIRRRGTHPPVSQMEDVTARADHEYKRPRPPSELPGSHQFKDYQAAQRVNGAAGSGYGGESGTTQGTWGSAAPTYSTAQQQMGPRPTGHDRVHELG